ncbi:ankyrin repeats (3 copies) domain-containing protein [Sarocladium implicatum]|nr:ankyrin repeats (3 copies) domain-containing protein [Sarocladium implicatum]
MATDLFDITHSCLEYFDRAVAKHDSALLTHIICRSSEDGVQKSRSSTQSSPPCDFLGIRNSFLFWIDYTGALSLVDSSLDARLQGLSDISAVVMELLEMVLRSLRRLDTIPESTTPQVTSDEDAETHSASPYLARWENACWAIESGLDQLHFVALAIRKASAKRLDQMVTTSITEEDAVFRKNIVILVRYRFTAARKALCQQLGDSIADRRQMILQSKKHAKKLAVRRPLPTPAAPIVSQEKPTPSKPSLDPKIVSRIVPMPSEVPSDMTKASRPDRRALEVRKLQAPRPKALSTVISTISTSQEHSLEYPDLPRAKPGELRVQCPYCFAPLEHGGSEKKRTESWRRHIDEHVKPYACLFPQCAKSLTFFTRRREWKAHMETSHPKDWLRKVHTMVWYCDMDHDEPLLFDTEDAWRNHMKELALHPKRKLKAPTPTQLDALAPRKQQAAPRDPFVCPLCEQIPQKIKPLVEKGSGDRIELENQVIDHVADHLKTLSLMALPSLQDGQNNPENSAESVEMMGDEDLKREMNEGSVAIPPSGIELIGNVPLVLDEWGDQTVDELWQSAGLENSWDHEYPAFMELENLPEADQTLWTGPWLPSTEDKNAQDSWIGDPVLSALMQWTLLHQAAAADDVPLIEDLLRLGANIEARDPRGRTALDTAAFLGKTHGLKALIDSGADINGSWVADGREPHSPIRLACEHGHVDAVRLLLNEGADLEYRGPSDTPWLIPSGLYAAASNGHAVIAQMLLDSGADVDWGWRSWPHGHVEGFQPLVAAVNDKNVQIVELLLARGARVDLLDPRGRTPLHWAALGAAPDIIQLLCLAGADVHATDEDDYSALNYAVDSVAPKPFAFAAVETLVSYGANVHARDGFSDTPLHRAAARRSVEVVEFLLARGADVNSQGGLGRSPLFCAVNSFCEHAEPMENQEELDERAHEVISLLIGAGASPNVPDQGGSFPLHRLVEAMANAVSHPCFQHRTSTVHLLLQFGADPNLIDHQGASAVSIATADDGTLRALLDAGGRWQVDDSETHSPLVQAAFHQQNASIELLLERGADINAIELRRDMTPLMMAAGRGHVETVDLLLEKGADVNIPDARGNTPLSTALRETVPDAVIYPQMTPNYLPDTTAVAKRLLSARAVVKKTRHLSSTAFDADDRAARRRNNRLQKDSHWYDGHCAGQLASGGGGWPLTDPQPLYGAARRGDAELVHLMLAAGSEINTWSETWAGDRVTELMGAAMSRSGQTVRSLLNAGADVNAQDPIGSGTTALIEAVGGSTELVGRLLQAGSDPNVRGLEGYTALSVAVELKRGDLVSILIEAGADVELSLDDKTTPLMLATRLGDAQLVLQLLRAGADPLSTDEDDRTAHDMAETESDRDLLLALRVWGSHAHNPDPKARMQSRLWTSVECGWIRGVEIALEDGADIEAVDELGYGVLHLALQKTPHTLLLATIQKLIDRGVPLEARDPTGKTPLELAIHLASTHRGPQPLRALMAAKTQLGLLQQMETALTIAQLVVLGGDSRAISRVFAKEGDPNATTDAAPFGALWLAVKFEEPEMVNALLDVGASAMKERTPFISLRAAVVWPSHVSSDANRHEVLKRLLETGAHPDDIVETKSGPASLIQVSAQRDDERAVRLLMDWGAVPKTADLVAAVRRGNIVVVQLLIDRGTDIHAVDDEGWTPLHHAAVCSTVRAPEVVRILIQAGAAINARGMPVEGQDTESMGNSVLHVASTYGVSETIRLLLAVGAEPNSRGIRDKTPLHLCARSNEIAGARLLLDYGADLSNRDIDGTTAISEAVDARWPDMVRFLLGQGAEAVMSGKDFFNTIRWAAEDEHIDIAAFLRISGATDKLSRANKLRLKEYLEDSGKPAFWDIIEYGNVKNEDGTSKIDDPDLLLRLEHLQKSKEELISGLAEKGEAGTARHEQLLNAMQSSDVEVIQKQLTAGVDVNAEDSHGDSVLAYAARCNKPELVPLLVEAGATFSSLIGKALSIALDLESPSMAEALLGASTDPRFNGLEDRARLTSLMEDLLEKTAMRKTALQKVKALIEAGASLAVLPLQYDYMRQLLKVGLDVKSDRIQPTALDASAGQDAEPIVRLLLGAGATKTDGEVLRWSAINGHIELAYFMSISGMVPVDSRNQLWQLANDNGNATVAEIFGFPDIVRGAILSDPDLINQLAQRGVFSSALSPLPDPGSVGEASVMYTTKIQETPFLKMEELLEL